MNLKELLATEELHHPTAFTEAFLEYLVDREEAAPAEVRDQIKKCTQFDLNAMGELIEVVYAHRDECGPILLEVVGKLAEFYDARNYLGQRNRGGTINSVLRATAKLPGSKMPKNDLIPAVLPKYLPPAEEVPEEEPPLDEQEGDEA